MTLSTDPIGLNPARGLFVLIFALLALPAVVLAQGRQLHMPPMSQLPGILYKCQSADGSRDFPVTEVRQLPGDQNVYWATMRTLGLSREEVKALNVKCALATPKSEPVQSAATSAPPSPKSGPFTRFTMGDYFNAIYNGDREEVRRQDQKYIGKLVADIKGRFGDNPIWKKIMDMMQVDRATLAEAAIRAYVQNYESAYRQCLRKDAVSFTIRQSTTNRDGAVVTMNETSYRVNPEFAAAFKATGEIADTVGGALSDMGYGSPVARTETGIHEIMSAYRCDDPVIKQFESGLLQMHAAHMARR